MSDKSLLSLREIAGELNLNYKTILNYKNQIGPFLPGLFDGKNFRYFPDCIEILRLIDALRNEGYTFLMIRDIFTQKQTISNDPHIKDWIDDCLSQFAHHWVDEDGIEQTGIDQGEPAGANIDADKPECSGPTMNDPVCSDTDGDGGESTGADWNTPGDAATDEAMPDYFGMDQNELPQSGLDANGWKWVKEDISRQFSGVVNDLVDEKFLCIQEVLSNTLTGIFQRMATENNIAITAICEVIEEIQQGLQAVDARLSALEEELGTETDGPIDMYRIEAGELQVSLPEIELDIELPRDKIPEPSEGAPDPHGLAGIRQSIENGRPDRDTVVQWVMTQRETQPPPSYKKLAGILNEAKIPTLSGRDAWSRSTLRNLAVRAEEA